MAETPANSFHIRPVCVAPCRMHILAATDRVVLMRVGDNQDYFNVHILRYMDPSPEEWQLKKLTPEEVPDMRLCTFKDNTTLCFIIDHYDPVIRAVRSYFGVLRAEDENLKKFLGSKLYRIDISLGERGHGSIISLTIVDNHAVIMTAQNNDDGPKVWKFEIPAESHSPLDDLVPEHCGTLEQAENIQHREKQTHSNGTLIAATLFDKEQKAFRNEVGDMITGRRYAIPDDLANFKVAGVSDESVMYWKCEQSTAHISILRLPSLEIIHFSAPIPMPEDEKFSARIEKWRLGFPCWTSGNRFFFFLSHTLLMGNLPGVDVPLEEAAASAIWRALSEHSQLTLIARNTCNKREILLRGMDLEETWTPDKYIDDSDDFPPNKLARLQI